MRRRLAVTVLSILIVLGMRMSSFNIPHAKGIVSVGGRISSDTVWTPEDIYRVMDNVCVDPSVTLTILPGVQIQFADGLSLIVNGSLNASGTDVHPIIFTSARVATEPLDVYLGAWNTIKFAGSPNEQFLLLHAKVEYAVHAVTVASTGFSRIDHCELTNCLESGIMLIEESNILIERNTIKHNRHGITSEEASTLTGIVVEDNEISDNRENGVYLRGFSGYTGYLQWIYNVTFSSNTISSNGNNGVFVYNAGGHIHDIAFSSNTIASNGRNGAYLYCFNYVYNVSFSRNIIKSNGENGVRAGAQAHYGSPFDLTITDNIISANSQKGVWINGGLAANLTHNSISYNLYGLFYTQTKDNLAVYNDIYHNTYGANVTMDASADARNNFWGQPTGPYHPILNPEGAGNPVNGDGEDLVLIPFLVSNRSWLNLRPAAAFSVDVNTVNINQTVTFNASGSTDDSRIDCYLFDFGDGKKSDWATLPTLMHKYASSGTFYATVTVMDDYGVTSNNTQSIKVQITVIPEFPPLAAMSLFMIATSLTIVVTRRNRMRVQARARAYSLKICSQQV